MAVIKCPECGHQVSELAPTCPGCGVEIAGKVIKCPDCGDIYFRTMMLCPTCHRPTSSAPAQPSRPVPVRHTEPVTPVPQPKHKEEPEKKSYTTLIVGLVIALVVCGVGAFYYNDAKKQREQNDFEFAAQSNDPLVIEQYLNEHKDENTVHRDSLQARLAMIQEMDKEWTDVVISGSRDQLEHYAKTHPDSPHKVEALNKLDSMDYAHVMKDKTVEAFLKYVKQHPDGRFVNDANAAIDAIKSMQLQPEESQMIKALFKKFFQSVNSRNESGMLSTVADQLTSFLGQSMAGKADVATFLNKIYKSDGTPGVAQLCS